MKKFAVGVFAAVLAAVLSATCFAAAPAPGVTRLDAASEIVQALYDGAYAGNGSFDIDAHYCLHESGYTHFVPEGVTDKDGYPVLCAVYASAEAPGFSDVAAPDNMISLAKAIGVVSGLPDGTFRPADSLTYDQAYTMLVSAFYKFWISSSVYPDGYEECAARAGFFDESASGSDAITAEAFDKMLAYCVSDTASNVRNTMFSPAASPEECAEKYAEAVKSRNGMLQYALYSDSLRESYSRADFESFGWVTGASSPWVESYSVKKLGEQSYEITLNWATSAGPEPSTALRLAIESAYRGWYVSSVDGQ